MAQETQNADLVACLPPVGTFTLTPGNATGYDGPPVMLVLNLRGGNTSEGALVQLWDDCHNEHNHWRFASYGGNMSFSIQSVTSGLYLSVPNGNSALGARPSLFALPAAFDGSFAWQLRQFPGRTTFVLENCATHTFLNVAGGRLHYGNKVHMWDNPDSQDSQWSVEAVSSPSSGSKRKAEVLDVED